MNSYYLSYIRRVFPLKLVALLLFITVFAFTAGTKLYTTLSKHIVINDNGTTLVATTMGYDVQQALSQLGIQVGEFDYINQPMAASLFGGTHLNNVFIKRAVPLNMTIDGQTRELMSWRERVSEVIADEGIVLGALDRYDGVTDNTRIVADMTIRIIRVREETLTEQEMIPFDVIETANNAMNEGETAVLQAGIDGVREKYYRIVYEDGKAVSREFLDEAVAKEPVVRKLEYGTVKNFTSSRGDLVRYAKAIDMKATAYTASFVDTGKNPGDPGFGITKTGMQVRTGMIAVDPRVIPLGSRVYVEVPGSAPDYGFAIASDIGSAIKGNLIDLYFDTSSEVKNWGRRKVRVYILNEQNDSRWKENTDPCNP